ASNLITKFTFIWITTLLELNRHEGTIVARKRIPDIDNTLKILKRMNSSENGLEFGLLWTAFANFDYKN
ncbi:hypothetical protein KIN20_009072, partial [Parelaphostrongylus tenuis]